MAYTVTYRSGTHRVEIDEVSPDRYRVRVDGRELEVDLCEPQPQLLSLLVGGRSYEIDVDSSPGGDMFGLTIRGDYYPVEVVDERRRRLTGSAPHVASGPQDVRSPMAGHVRQVLVSEGDAVETGSPLVILEAMKMQNEIRAPMDGRVQVVSGCAGVTVSAGDPLVVVTPHP
jgi:biotin carboxyl carrier protein